MPLVRYGIRRALTFPLQVFAAVTFIFFLIHVFVGSPVFRQLGVLQTPELASRLTEQLGLDQPVGKQYIDFMSHLVRGDLGTSFGTSEKVTTDLIQLFPSTLELVGASLFIGLIIGVPLGVLAGLRGHRRLTRATSGYRLIAGSIPEFWLGLIFIYLFVSILGIAPGPVGQLSPDLEPPPRITGMIVLDALVQGMWRELASGLAHLALPALALGLSIGGPVARLMRAVVADACSSDYVQYAELSGARPRTVLWYILKSTLTPLINLIAVLTVLLIGQTVPVEIVFSWGGLGQYTVQAVQLSDYPAIQGVVLITTMFVLVVYLANDLVAGLIDQRLIPAEREHRRLAARELLRTARGRLRSGHHEAAA